MRLPEWRIKSLRQNILTFGRVGRKSINFCSDVSRKEKREELAAVTRPQCGSESEFVKDFHQEEDDKNRAQCGCEEMRKNLRSEYLNPEINPKNLNAYTLSPRPIFSRFQGARFASWCLYFRESSHEVYFFPTRYSRLEAYQKSEKSHTCTATSPCFVLSVEHSIVFFLLSKCWENSKNNFDKNFFQVQTCCSAAAASSLGIFCALNVW